MYDAQLEPLAMQYAQWTVGNGADGENDHTTQALLCVEWSWSKISGEYVHYSLAHLMELDMFGGDGIG